MVSQHRDSIIPELIKLARMNHTTHLLPSVLDFIELHLEEMVKEAMNTRSERRKNFTELEEMLILKMGLLCNLKCRNWNVAIVNSCMKLIGYDGYDDKKRFRQRIERFLKVMRKEGKTKESIVRSYCYHECGEPSFSDAVSTG